MSIDSLCRSTVTHTLLILGSPASPVRLLFVDERSGETTTFLASRDENGLGLTEQPHGRTVRLGYASGPAGRHSTSAGATLHEVVRGARYHLHRGDEVWGVDRLEGSALLLQACGAPDQAAVRGNEQPALGAARAYDVWISNAHPIEAARNSVSAIAMAVSTLLLSFDAA